MTALLPSSRSRIWTMSPLVSATSELGRSDAERRTAAAGRLHVGVLELEACSLQPFDVVDLGADQVHEAHLVDDNLDALDLELAVDLGGLIEVQVVREAGTTAAHDAQPQRHVG